MKLAYAFTRFVRLPARVLWEGSRLLVGLFRLGPLLARGDPGRKSVAFQAYSTHLAQFYEPVISVLLRDNEAVDVHFVVLPHPHFPLGSAAELKEYAIRRLGIPEKNVRDHWQIMWKKFDLFLTMDQYALFPLRPTRRYLLMHGPGVTTRLVRRHPLRKSLGDFDVTLFNGDFDVDLVRSDRREVGTTELVAAGLPYLDRLAHPEQGRKAYLASLSLDPERRAVLVAPSWNGSSGPDMHDDGQLEAVVRALADRGLSVIVKLHACSFNVLMARGVDWRSHVSVLDQIPNVSVDYDVDDVPALAHADVLVTDISSSRSFNFMLLDKPVILYGPRRPSRDEWDAKRTELMSSGAFLASNAAELDEILDRYRDESEMGTKRAAVARRCFSNFGSATAVVVDLLERDLNGGSGRIRG